LCFASTGIFHPFSTRPHLSSWLLKTENTKKYKKILKIQKTQKVKPKRSKNVTCPLFRANIIMSGLRRLVYALAKAFAKAIYD